MNEEDFIKEMNDQDMETDQYDDIYEVTLITQHKHEIKQITKDIPTSETTKETWG